MKWFKEYEINGVVFKGPEYEKGDKVKVGETVGTVISQQGCIVHIDWGNCEGLGTIWLCDKVQPLHARDVINAMDVYDDGISGVEVEYVLVYNTEKHRVMLQTITSGEYYCDYMARYCDGEFIDISHIGFKYSDYYSKGKFL